MKIRSHQVVSVPGLYDDPMRINQERDDLEHDQKATARANVIRADQGQPQVPLPSKGPENTSISSPLGDAPIRTKQALKPPDAGPSSVKYSYEARIRNDGAKTIRMVVWTYSFVDPATGVEVGQRLLTSPTSAPPGETVNLVVMSTTRPVRVVQAAKPNNEKKHKYLDRVTVDRVEYEDGTFWQRSPP